MGFTEFANSLVGLITAITGLLVAAAGLIEAIRKFIEMRRRKLDKHPTAKLPPGRNDLFSFVLVGISASLIALSTSILLARDEQPLNVQLTVAAWDAFNAGNYQQAIARADKCINEFRGSADREQVELQNSKAPLPPKGKVSEEEKKRILARGLLNDVATCFFIKGRSAENVGRIPEAREAYLAASKYTYARTWDPKGWFWSPAEAASDRLTTLK